MSEMPETEKLSQMLRYVIILWALLTGVAYAQRWYETGSPFPRDDTDSASARSGMDLRTDFGTGCQYLATSGGGLTPRLSADGKQKGCRS